ncbi:MAG: TonB-dependent receptor plug domain-containing protein [Tahibacter sp.]
MPALRARTAGLWLTILCVAAAPAAETSGDARDDALRAATRLGRVDVTAPTAAAATPLPATSRIVAGSELERDHVDGLQALSVRVPNLRVSGLGGRAGQHTIGMRGLANAWSAAESAVVLRIDDVNLSDPLSFDQRLFDVERIEVFAGPQGSRFGGNAEAGAIELTTRRPDDPDRAFATIGVGSRGGFETGVGASGALGNEVYASAVGLHDARDGDIDNRVGASAYDTKRDRNLRTRLLWKPSDHGELDLQLLDRHSNDRGGEIYLPVDLAAFNMLPTLGGIRLGRFEQAINDEGSNRVDATLAALTARWSDDAITWSAQISARRSAQSSSTDYDLSPQNWFVMNSRWRVSERQLELRAKSANPARRVRWHAGAYLDRRDIDTQRRFEAASGNPWQLPQGRYVRTDANLPDRTEALFGEASVGLDAAARWRLGAGARVQWARRDLEFGANAVGAPAAMRQSAFYQFLPTLSLEFQPAGAPLTLHASIAQGGRPGGFNPGTFSAAQAAYRAERLSATEIGAHSATESTQWRVAAFTNRVRDYQDLTFAESEFTTYLRNVPRASMRGIEVQVQRRLDAHWHLGANLGTARTRYDDDNLLPGGGAGLDGRRLAQVPAYSAALETGFESGPWFLSAEWVMAGSFRVNVYNAADRRLRESGVPGYRIANLSAGWRGDHWSLTAWGHNIGDRRYFTSAGYGFAATALYPGAVGAVGPRRAFGIGVRWDQ